MGHEKGPRQSNSHAAGHGLYSTLSTTDGMAPTRGTFRVRHRRGLPCLVFLVWFLRMWISSTIDGENINPKILFGFLYC